MGNCIEMDSLTPPEVENANVESLNLLPERTKMLYQKTYDESVAWCAGKLVVRYSEFVLLTSFSEISEKGSIALLWPKYSMLRSTLCIHHDLDLSN
ncbi:hypothetical protein Zmor_002111 [Zophobas morio]|uniref:Uncharacterized protein n=1 Tax=Zophobas morio TaxID=2755281 RepID=A0AA38IZX7_9CUCU|nr:hypothetical protein Zmor_002111 [Zophobas morio]